jgi:hypothetical protein
VSLDAVDWVWQHSDSQGVARHIMLILANEATTNVGDCTASGSLTFLAKRANCHRSAVSKALAALYALGDLEVVPGNQSPAGDPSYRLIRAIGHVRPEAP